MLLVTTADPQTWGNGEKILFLGEWCKRYSQRNTWSKLDYEVAPIYDFDREQLFNKNGYPQQVYERYLDVLAERLNQLHQVTFSLRYWRILIGPWLNTFIGVLFDRFQSIDTVIKSGTATNTKILKFGDTEFIPENMIQTEKFFISDSYNHYIYGKIIQFLGDLSYEIIDDSIINKESEESLPEKEHFGWRYYTVKQLSEKLKKKFNSPNKYLFIHSYLTPKAEFLLQFSLGQIAVLYPHHNEPPSAKVDLNQRKQLSFRQSKNEFERCLESLIPKQIPIIYVEGYKNLRYHAYCSGWPKETELAFTANAYHTNDVFKCWVAEQTENGMKFVIGQHGGHMGTGLWNASECHQIHVSDYYFSWGWEDKKQSKVIPLPSNKLIESRPKPNTSGKILWIIRNLLRYSTQMPGIPASSVVLEYLKGQERFAKSVCPSVHELLLVRLYMENYGWDEFQRFRDFDPSLKIYRGNSTLYEQLQESRLFIGTNNSTTYLEAFAMNFPSIIFWNKDIELLRESAKPYFRLLEEAEILHYSPESAAALINKIYNNPLLWWKQPKVQKAKNEFCKRYAWTSKNWALQWRKKLLKCRKDK